MAAPSKEPTGRARLVEYEAGPHAVWIRIGHAHHPSAADPAGHHTNIEKDLEVERKMVEVVDFGSVVFTDLKEKFCVICSKYCNNTH